MSPNPVVLFLRLSRPTFLLGGFTQYAMGAGIAKYLKLEINWNVFWLGMLWVATTQLATQYLNEYFDADADAGNPNRTSFSGGSGVLGDQEGQLPRSLGILAAGSMLTAVLVFTFGLLRAGVFNPETSIVAVLIFLGAIFYSAPPVKLASSGYGELTTAILIANLLPAFGFLLQAGEFHPLVAMSTFPLTGMLMAMMITIEFPDYGNDLKFDKLTLLVRAGWERGMVIHHISIFTSYGLLLLALFNGFPAEFVWYALLPVPLAIYQVWHLRRIAAGAKPNWNRLAFSGVMLFGFTSYILTLLFWIG